MKWKKKKKSSSNINKTVEFDKDDEGKDILKKTK